MGANAGLERAYRETGRAGGGALERKEWPRSEYFLKHCEVGSDGALLPRRFENNGVVGVSVQLGEDPDHVALLTKAQHVFSDILQEARERGLAPAAGQEWAERGVWWAPREAWHTVVTIFSENPDLLSAEERIKWRPVPEDKLKYELGTELKSEIWAYPVSPVNLRLYGYRVCQDGALIACFVDDDAEDENIDFEKSENCESIDERTAFGSLRRRVKQIGGKLLGPLTSRPKCIIHVTLGRVLRLPGSADDEEREHLLAHLNAVANKLHANETIDFSADERAVPGGWRIAVEGAPPRDRIVVPGLHEVLRVKQASLTVEKRWWMMEFDVLATIPLAQAK